MEKGNLKIGPEVSRDEVIENAVSFVKCAWKPGLENVHHGMDKDGFRVDTPDVGYKWDTGSGWWTPDQINTGIPYKWGGFCTISFFKECLERGLYAGNIPSLERMKNLVGGGESSVGVDCSGYVSRCWKLSRPVSTRQLSEICERLPGPDYLQRGDILNKANSHVVIFKEFVDETQEHMIVYESSRSTGRVGQKECKLSILTGKGFIPYRYTRISN